MTVKETVKKAIDTLPAEVSIDEIINTLYVIAKFQHGETEIKNGEGIPHSEALSQMKKWQK